MTTAETRSTTYKGHRITLRAQPAGARPRSVRVAATADRSGEPTVTSWPAAPSRPYWPTTTAASGTGWAGRTTRGARC